MQLSRFSILTILALTGCEASDEMTLEVPNYRRASGIDGECFT